MRFVAIGMREEKEDLEKLSQRSAGLRSSDINIGEDYVKKNMNRVKGTW